MALKLTTLFVLSTLIACTALAQSVNAKSKGTRGITVKLTMPSKGNATLAMATSTVKTKRSKKLPKRLKIRVTPVGRLAKKYKGYFGSSVSKTSQRRARIRVFMVFFNPTSSKTSSSVAGIGSKASSKQRFKVRSSNGDLKHRSGIAESWTNTLDKPLPESDCDKTLPLVNGLKPKDFGSIPWNGSYWPTYEDNINYQWKHACGAALSAEKFRMAFPNLNYCQLETKNVTVEKLLQEPLRFSYLWSCRFSTTQFQLGVTGNTVTNFTAPSGFASDNCSLTNGTLLCVGNKEAGAQTQGLALPNTQLDAGDKATLSVRNSRGKKIETRSSLK